MNSKFSWSAELLAEFLGTFVLILFGTGVVAMVVLFPTKNPGETIHGGTPRKDEKSGGADRDTDG